MLQPQELLKFAASYGTPLFVYDADVMLSRYHDLHKFIKTPTLQVHYALKANYNPALLTLLRDAGCGIDAVSPAEVLLALQLGFAKEKIVYTANNMTDDEFDLVMATGVIINIGSLSRLRKTAAKYPGSKLCLRFNPDVCDGDNAKTMTGGDLTKFGILLDAVEEVRQIVAGGDLHIVGLHEHTGSGL
ncbi:MAG: diaminopimelate decarboxylase, partial [Lentisphaeria bacterium]|nr:diaminopimelate decarboxylase [Lentisphaeria bacterium]